MNRTIVVGFIVLTVLLVSCIVAVAVLAVKLNDEKAEESSDNVQPDKETLTNCEDVAIIGAGISGAYASWRLRKKNLNIALYEFSNRIGGRCFTIKLPGIPDVNVEMGAMRFRPDDHPLINQTITDLGLEIVDFELGYGSGGGSLFYLRGKHMTYDELAKEAPYNMPPENRVDLDKLHWHLYKNFTTTSENGNVIKSLDGVDLHMQSTVIYMDKYLDVETTQFIKDSSNFISRYSTGVTAQGYITVSDPNVPSEGPKAVKTVSEGFQAIPETMVEQFLTSSYKHNFYRNHHLKAIHRQDDGNYVLTFQPTETKAGITSDLKSASTVKKCAKKVILAIPRIALEHLDWEGLKDETVQDYIRHSLTEVRAGKMYFGYDTAWWRQLDKASNYAISMTPLRQTYDFAVSKSTSKGVLNPGYPDGDTSIWREVAASGTFVKGVGDNSIAMTDIGVHLARKYFAEIFNITRDEVPEPDSAVMKIWDQYPIGASWYLWAPGYNWSEVEARMLKPSANDDVYTAANVFSSARKSGWTEGALEIVEKILPYFD